MHPSLRPELRGAQRILRSIQHPPSSSSHRVVRSFTSYRRLQAQSNPSNSPPSPSDSGSNGSRGSQGAIPQQIQDLIRSLSGGAIPQFLQGQDGRSPTPDQLFELGKAWDSIKKVEQDKTGWHQSLKRGEIPTGYKLVKDMKDVPSWLTKEVDKFPELPFLISEDPSRDPKIAALPSDFQQASQSSDSTPNQQDISPSENTTSKDAHNAAKTAFYGSISARRKRARENKQSPKTPESLPTWFLENNIRRLRTDRTHFPGVLAVKRLSDGSYTPATCEVGQAEAVKIDTNKGPSDDDGEPLEQTHGTGGEQPKPDAGNRNSARPPTHDVQNYVSLSDTSYYIEEAQYQELFSTFKGKVQSLTAASQNVRDSLALNHLTINHSHKDADTLLDILVTDLCQAVGADKARLDIQDISELIAKAEVDPEIASKGGRLSFKIYNDIYETKTLDDAMFTAGEDEDDMEDDGDSGPPGAAFGISGPIQGGIPKGLLHDLTRSLNTDGGPMIQFFGPGNNSSRSSVGSGGMFGSLIDSIIDSSINQARPQKDDENAEVSTEAQSEEKQVADARPLVIHLPNYRALQNHKLSDAFMGQLIETVDRRGQRIMIVGTDCVRDDRTQKAVQTDPKLILEEQNSKSFGVSSNILLTPVFPDSEAEYALTRDREQRLRNINARHLWLILQARGYSLNGLEAGFWSRDFSKEISGLDGEILGKSFWPFLTVQRLAALIAGTNKTPTDNEPIFNALMTLKASDSSKVAWAKRTQPLSRVLQSLDEEQPTNKTLSKIRSKATRHEKKLLSGVIEPNKIATTFRDIHIPAETIEALQTLTTLSLVRPEAFRYGVLKSDRIPGLLLYGPPGTGKTLAAKAVAKESGATMLEVSAADLNDMYVGEGEKNVQALFSLAKKLSPCVVFLDEADAMFSARSAQGRRVSHRELLNQFLKEWDGMSNDSGSAFIMVATNRPMDLDDAVLRRLPRRLLVDLPTENDRLEILRIHLRHENLSEDVNLPELAKKTPFYSGSDLKNVAVAAALNAVREENEAAKKYKTENPDAETPYQYPEKRILTGKHFEKALEEISASISEDMSSLKEIKKFDEQYGDRKGRKRKSPRWGFKSPSEADKVLETVKVRS